MRIALACSGMGRVQRGYERFTEDLFNAINDRESVTLFKGDGVRTGTEKVLWSVSRDGLLKKIFPDSPVPRLQPYYYECLTFALSFLPHLVRGRYQIVHYIDPPLGNFLYRLRDKFRLDYQMVYTNGVGMSPRHYQRPDHIHQMSLAHYQTAVDYGIPETRMTVLPPGVNKNRLLSAASKKEIRRKYGVADDTFVVLSVSAINRSHKRIDYLVEETAALSKDCLLWVDGHVEDESILTVASERLGRNCRITHVSSQSVGDLYQLADLFVLASLEEGFGIAIVEAMYSGLPVLVHRNAHFSWLVGNENCLVDMENRGNLAARIAHLMDHPLELGAISSANAAEARKRFDWSASKEGYLEMYRRIISGHN